MCISIIQGMGRKELGKKRKERISVRLREEVIEEIKERGETLQSFVERSVDGFLRKDEKDRK
ncbi:hypothetical protein A5N86_16665 [Geobacillus thermoleovorans]|nr:hypothetical protein A5N86_16665 [Geobacillus thermoleovorans]